VTFAYRQILLEMTDSPCTRNLLIEKLQLSAWMDALARWLRNLTLNICNYAYVPKVKLFSGIT